MARHFAEGLTIHCDGPDGNDYTLCGFALEGEDGNEPLIQTAAQINCEQCIGVINWCHSVRVGEVCSPFQRRAARS